MRSHNIGLGHIHFTNTHSRIYLIHQTAKEFLIQTEIVTASSGWKYSLNPVESEKLMARICVKYLLLKDFNDMNPISIKDNIHLDNDFGNNEVDDGMEDVRLSDSQVLLHYSARHWPSHVYKSMITKTPFLMEVLRLYQLEHNRFRVWFPIFWLQQHNVPNGELNDIRLAAYIGHDDVLRSLVNDENMNVGDLNGKTPLFWAVKGGHEAIVAILLDQGVDINASCYAIYFDAEVCLPQTDNGDALTLAAEDGNVNFVKALIEKGANLNAGALQKASEKGHMDVVELLVEMGTNINEVGRRYGSALQQASSGGNLEIAKFLLEKGANVEGPGGKFVAALQAASFSGREEIVKLLLAKGADINAKGGFLGSALQAASSAGEVETVKLLLANGADVNAEGGMLAEHSTLSVVHQWTHDYHCIEIVRLLIAKGADVNAEGGFFGNAVHAASYGGRVEVVKFLLENGADVEARGGKFANALQASCADNCGRGTTNDSCTEIVRLLVAKGADVNAEGGIFGSALQAALFYAQHGAVEVLLDNGANVTLMMKGRGRWKWNGLGDGKEWIANVIEKYGKERRYEWIGIKRNNMKVITRNV